ncbi:unnamed protein product, partial [Brachionus calyciflorus]
PALTAAQALTQVDPALPSLTKASTKTIKPESPKLTLSSLPISPFAFDGSFEFGRDGISTWVTSIGTLPVFFQPVPVQYQYFNVQY